MRYIFRRLIFYVVALWVAITANFAIPRLMPGNPAEIIYAQNASVFNSDPGALNSIKAMLNLSSDPMPIQYWHYLGQLLHGNLGVSFTQFPVPVSDIIRTHLPWTLFLVGTASIMAFILGTLLGVICSWRRGGIFDSILVPVTAITSSFPVFFLALLLLYYCASVHTWFPTGHAFDPGDAPHFSLPFIGEMIYHALLPAFTLVVVSIGGWLLGMRNAMINTLAEDYVTMATAKGLTDRRVMLMYAARNAILPQVTGFAMALGFVIGGAFLIELVFDYEGIGFFLIRQSTMKTTLDPGPASVCGRVRARGQLLCRSAVCAPGPARSPQLVPKGDTLTCHGKFTERGYKSSPPPRRATLAVRLAGWL